jgi:HAD superfamily hydrolase (TIGR01509 family)
VSVAADDLDPAAAVEELPAAVLWDLDGTLVDSEPLWFEAEQQLAARHGATWSTDHAKNLVGNSLPRSGAYIREHMRIPLSVEEILEELLLYMEAHMARRAAFRPGALELLGALRAAGVPCALVTMSYRRLVDPLLPRMAESAFAAVVCGDEVEHGKPHPEAYLRAAELLGVDPADCVVIEDSPGGAAAGEAAGARVVVVPHVVEVPSGPGRVQVPTLAGLDVAGLVAAVAGLSA